MIDLKEKRETIKAADISPQELWWKKNLLAAYKEIEELRQQRANLLVVDHLGTCYKNLRMGDCNCGLDEAMELWGE